jgi:hypothetical protein
VNGPAVLGTNPRRHGLIPDLNLPQVWAFGSASSFGSPGPGGALGFADPTAAIGYADVTNQMGTRLTGDPRDVALRQALYAALDSQRRVPERRAS